MAESVNDVDDDSREDNYEATTLKMCTTLLNTNCVIIVVTDNFFVFEKETFYGGKLRMKPLTAFVQIFLALINWNWLWFQKGDLDNLKTVRTFPYDYLFEGLALMTNEICQIRLNS